MAQSRLAIFDLDHTLLLGDSDYLWGQFLIEQGLVDSDSYARENRRFYDAYCAGNLDIHEFAAFSLNPLVMHGEEKLAALRSLFLREKIEPIIAPAAPLLLERHRLQGDLLLITTATNRFITEPIAALLNVDVLFATDPEVVDGKHTGRIRGVPNFREGKRLRLEEWRATEGLGGAHTTVYSDSHNDLPLLSVADRPVAVDPDDVLRAVAEREGWPIISLRHVNLELQLS